MSTTVPVLADPRVSTYRFLRIAVVAAIGALLLAIGLDYIGPESGERTLLTSISAYYFSPVGPAFVGGLFMAGASLFVLRSREVVEEVLLNFAGVMALIVAFIPTGCPEELCEASARIRPQEELFGNTNLRALAIIVALAWILTIWLVRNHESRREVQRDIMLAFFGLSAAVVVVTIADRLGDFQDVHNVAAIFLIIGLLLTALFNAVSHVGRAQPQATGFLPQEGSTPPWWKRPMARRRLRAALAGVSTSAVVVAVAALVSGATLIVTLVALVVAIAVTGYLWRQGAVSDFYNVILNPGYNPSVRWYAVVALAMMILVPVTFFLLDTNQHRIFWVELAALLPFGGFWVVQTQERWGNGLGYRNVDTEELPPRTDEPDGGDGELVATTIGLDLVGTDFRGQSLEQVDLRGANLGGANLSGVTLKGVDLRDADLTGADLTGTTLIDTDLSGADVTHARLDKLSGQNVTMHKVRRKHDYLTQEEIIDLAEE
ncbi:MAG: pentapeptide repeat-containing protein [Actinomycetota bacterium]